MLVGIGFIAIITGALANSFISRAGGPEGKTQDRLDDVIERLDRLEAIVQEQARGTTTSRSEGLVENCSGIACRRRSAEA
jgi:hypothetical protein